MKTILLVFIMWIGLGVAQANKVDPLPVDLESLSDAIKAEALAVDIAEETEVKAEEIISDAESNTPLFVQKEERDRKQEKSLLIRMIFSLSAVLGVIFCALFVLRKWRKHHPKPLHSNSIKVIAQKYIGHKKCLAIIQVAGESILIGMTDQSINHIRTLSLLDEEMDSELSQRESFHRNIKEDDFEMGPITSLVRKKVSKLKEI